MHIRVVSKRAGGTKPVAGEVVVNIARPSLLGNPFHMANESQRDEVVQKYQAWLEQRYLDTPAIHDELHRLAARAKAGEKLALQCWCAPCKCHGDVIKQAIEWIVRQ